MALTAESVCMKSVLKLSAFDGLKSKFDASSSSFHGASVLSTSASASSYSHASKIPSVRAVATPIKPPSTLPAKRSKVEIYKEESNFLRFPLLDELANDNPNVNAAAEQLIKFHGSYQQDNREVRIPGAGKSYQFMMRTRQPGGKVDNRLYLKMDELADIYGNGTLRLTTRQTFQLHGVLKENLKTVFSTVIKNMGSTLGACGDLNRNVLAPVVPYNTKPEYLYTQEYADKIAMLLAPQAGAYYDVWLDGEKAFTAEEPEDVVKARLDNRFGTNFEGCPEPIYGTQFLPRKFKMAITVPGDNSVDILTNDVGLVVMCDSEGSLQGFNIYVGGGMGRTHRKEETEPLLAQPLGYVAKGDIFHAVKAIVATQRDYGRRDDRRQARMKYLIRDWGLEKFKSVVEQYFGKKIEDFRELPEWTFNSYVGWGDQGDGKLFYGLHIENGRIKGEAKKALRAVIEKYELPVRISANQNLVLCDIRKAWRAPITRDLASVGILGKQFVDPINLTAMACPALPLCSLAVTEAERGLPDVLRTIRSLLEKVGLKRRATSLVVRMTGCPNGCARPYMAELGFVGDGPNSYQIWLGGTPNQTVLARLFLDKVKLEDFPKVLTPIFAFWKKQGLKDESFGEFTNRIGFAEIHEFITQYRTSSKRVPPRLVVDPELLAELRVVAEKKGVTPSSLASDAITAFLRNES